MTAVVKLTQNDLLSTKFEVQIPIINPDSNEPQSGFLLHVIDSAFKVLATYPKHQTLRYQTHFASQLDSLVLI